MAINKLVLGTEVKFDLTADTVTADKLAKGITAHDKTGAQITGTSTKDSDTQDATAAVAEVLKGKTFYARGAKMTGTMPDQGAVAGTIDAKDGQYTVPMGFHDGGGKVGLAAAEKAKLIPGNIKSGLTILGVEGTYSGETVKAMSKSVTSSLAAQTILPDEGYDYLSSVTIAGIPVVETDNAAGGKTLTIGG